MNQHEQGIERLSTLKPGEGLRVQQRVGLLASRVACSIGRTKDGKGFLYMRGYIAGWPIADAWEGRKHVYVKTCKEQGLKHFASAAHCIEHALKQHPAASI